MSESRKVRKLKIPGTVNYALDTMKNQDLKHVMVVGLTHDGTPVLYCSEAKWEVHSMLKQTVDGYFNFQWVMDFMND